MLYNQRGVSSAKEDVHKAIQHLDKGIFPKAFPPVGGVLRAFESILEM